MPNSCFAIKSSSAVEGYKVSSQFDIKALLQPKVHNQSQKTFLADKHPEYWKLIAQYFDNGTSLAASRRESTMLYKDARLSLAGAQSYLASHGIAVSRTTVGRSLHPARIGSISSQSHHPNYLEIRMGKPKKDADINGHLDSHYQNALIYNLRELMKAYDDSITISMDDKAQIKTGVAAVQKAIRIWGGTGVSVSSHDYCLKADSLTATVRLILDTDKSAARNTGQVFYTIKMSALSPSSPLQHLTDQLLLLEKHPEYFSKNDKVAKKWCVLSDGGPDVSTRKERVRIAYALLMWILDLDCVLLCSYEAKGSAKNPGERAHGTVNAALSGVVLPREDLIAAQAQLVSILSPVSHAQRRLIVEAIVADLLFFDSQWYDLFRGKKERLFSTIGDKCYPTPKRLQQLMSQLEVKVKDKIPTINQFRKFIGTHSTEGKYWFSLTACGHTDCIICCGKSFLYPAETKTPPLPVPSMVNTGHYLPLQQLYLLDEKACNTPDFYLPSLLVQQFTNNFSEHGYTEQDFRKLWQCCCFLPEKLLEQQIHNSYNAKLRKQLKKLQKNKKN